jgi:hypothetical protein
MVILDNLGIHTPKGSRLLRGLLAELGDVDPIDLADGRRVSGMVQRAAPLRPGHGGDREEYETGHEQRYMHETSSFRSVGRTSPAWSITSSYLRKRRAGPA